MSAVVGCDHGALFRCSSPKPSSWWGAGGSRGCVFPGGMLGIIGNTDYNRVGLLTEGNTLLVIDKASRDERRKIQTEGAQRLIESGMLDDLFAKIDAGEVQLDGDGGFIQQLIKTGL